MKFKGYIEKDGKVLEVEFDIDNEEVADERLASTLETFKRLLKKHNREAASPRPKAFTKASKARDQKVGGGA